MRKKNIYYIAKHPFMSKEDIFKEYNKKENDYKNITSDEIDIQHIKFCRTLPDMYFNSNLIKYNKNLVRSYESLNEIVEDFVYEYTNEELVSILNAPYLREEALQKNFFVFKYDETKDVFSIVPKKNIENVINDFIEKDMLDDISVDNTTKNSVVKAHNEVLQKQLTQALSNFKELLIVTNDNLESKVSLTKDGLVFSNKKFMETMSEKAIGLYFYDVSYSFTLKVKTDSVYNGDDFYYEIYGYSVVCEETQNSENEVPRRVITFKCFECDVLKSVFTNEKMDKENFIYCDITGGKNF